MEALIEWRGTLVFPCRMSAAGNQFFAADNCPRDIDAERHVAAEFPDAVGEKDDVVIGLASHQRDVVAVSVSWIIAQNQIALGNNGEPNFSAAFMKASASFSSVSSGPVSMRTSRQPLSHRYCASVSATIARQGVV